MAQEEMFFIDADEIAYAHIREKSVGAGKDRARITLKSGVPVVIYDPKIIEKLRRMFRLKGKAMSDYNMRPVKGCYRHETGDR